MNGNTERLTRVRWFWAWDAPKEERWLEQMARDGWHLVSGGIRFQFRRGAPSECRYRLDYRTERKADLEEYLDLCRQSGWEMVSRFGAWYYFRNFDPDAPELHSDPSSLADRYRRLLALLIILLSMNVVLFVTRPAHSPRLDFFYQVAEFLRFGAMALLAFGVIRIGLYIRDLQRESASRG